MRMTLGQQSLTGSGLMLKARNTDSSHWRMECAKMLLPPLFALEILQISTFLILRILSSVGDGSVVIVSSLLMLPAYIIVVGSFRVVTLEDQDNAPYEGTGAVQPKHLKGADGYSSGITKESKFNFRETERDGSFYRVLTLE